MNTDIFQLALGVLGLIFGILWLIFPILFLNRIAGLKASIDQMNLQLASMLNKSNGHLQTIEFYSRQTKNNLAEDEQT